MKILAIGDFHGKLNSGFKKIIKDEKIDLIISIGDYLPFHYRKLWFKHCYGKEVELSEIIGKKKYKELVLEDLRRGEVLLKKLNDLSIPVFTVLGNVDWGASDDISDKSKKRKKFMPNYDKKESFTKRLKKYKNIKRFDYKALKFGDYIFVGMRGHSFPGDIKSKAFKKHQKKLERLFEKYKKENKEGKLIFVSHNIAHNTKLDKISMKAVRNIEKSSGKKFSKKTLEKKRHYGSKLAKRIVAKYNPILHLGGHIHEGKGKDKVGKTLCINPGEASKGEGTIINLEKGKIKSVKFVK